MVIIIASLNSILPLLVSISLGATLSVSSQRHIRVYFGSQPHNGVQPSVFHQACSQALWFEKENTSSKGKIFVFTISFQNNIFWAQTLVAHKKILGGTAPECSSVSPGW